MILRPFVITYRRDFGSQAANFRGGRVGSSPHRSMLLNPLTCHRGEARATAGVVVRAGNDCHIQGASFFGEVAKSLRQTGEGDAPDSSSTVGEKRRSLRTLSILC